jgi:hypothetical protein
MTTTPTELITTLDGKRIAVDEVWLSESETRAVSVEVNGQPAVDLLLLDLDMARQLVHDLTVIIAEDDGAALRAWRAARPAGRLRVVR